MLGEQVYKHLLSGPELGGNRGNYILGYPRKLRIKDRRAQKKRVLMTRAPRASMRRTQMGQPLMRRAPIQSPNGKDLVGKDRNGKGPKRKETRRFWLREQRRGGRRAEGRSASNYGFSSSGPAQCILNSDKAVSPMPYRPQFLYFLWSTSRLVRTSLVPPSCQTIHMQTPQPSRCFWCWGHHLLGVGSSGAQGTCSGKALS